MYNPFTNNMPLEVKQFHCTILLEDVKEKVRKLKAYGVDEAVIEAVIHDDELLPQLIVTPDYELMLNKRGHQKVKMEPLVRAVYLLFLRHPEGIVLKHLPDYRQELTRIYQKVRPGGLTARAQKSLDMVTDPTCNSINEKCARIKRAFAELTHQSIAPYYSISGKRGEAKRILLPRTDVVWQCRLG